MNDRIVVHKQDGTTSGTLPAVVSKKSIITDHNGILIESGDIIVRSMSNGGEETYKVIEPNFSEAFGGIPAHYQMEVQNLNSMQAKAEITRISYHITGDNNKILYHSTDNSINAPSAQDEIWGQFGKLRDEVSNIRDLSATEIEDCKAAIDAIENQISSEKPNKRLIKQMVDMLPNAANIATIGSTLLGLLS